MGGRGRYHATTVTVLNYCNSAILLNRTWIPNHTHYLLSPWEGRNACFVTPPILAMLC